MILFAVSGVMILGTFTAYDGCALYKELSTNSKTIPSLSFYNDSEVIQVL